MYTFKSEMNEQHVARGSWQVARRKKVNSQK